MMHIYIHDRGVVATSAAHNSSCCGSTSVRECECGLVVLQCVVVRRVEFYKRRMCVSVNVA